MTYKKALFAAIWALILAGAALLNAQQNPITPKEPLDKNAKGSFLSEEPNPKIPFLPPDINASEPFLLQETASEPFLLQTTASQPAFLESSPFSEGLRVLTSIAAIILTAFALLWLLQKKGGLGSNIYGKVIGIMPLDNKKALYIVDIMGRVLVLGVTEANINMLCEITDKITIDALRLQSDNPKSTMTKFLSFLKGQGANKAENNTNETPKFEAASSFAERTNERLQRLNELLSQKHKQKPNS